MKRTVRILKGEEPMDILLVAATAAEASWLLGAGNGAKTSPFLVTSALEGLRAGVLVTGPGPVNAALAVGAALSRYRAGLVLVFGIGGAYPGSGLAPGDLAVATAEIDADTGLEPEKGGFAPSLLSIPLVRKCDADAKSSEALLSAAKGAGKALAGPFVTSATVTATAARAESLGRIHGALCENMEGFAAARAATLAGVPFCEVRGISNMAGPRDLKSWKTGEAVARVEAAVKEFMRTRFAEGPR